MAKLPTDEDKRRGVLRIFNFFKARPGNVLILPNFLARADEVGLSMDEIAEGLEILIKTGAVERVGATEFRLTQSGYELM